MLLTSTREFIARDLKEQLIPHFEVLVKRVDFITDYPYRVAGVELLVQLLLEV